LGGDATRALDADLLNGLEDTQLLEFAREVGFLDGGLLQLDKGPPVDSDRASWPPLGQTAQAGGGSGMGMGVGMARVGSVSASATPHQLPMSPPPPRRTALFSPTTHASLDDTPTRAKKAVGSSGGSKRSGGRSSGAGDKGGKGLRHFSWKVCEKVRQKKRTTYVEVADELVQQLSDPHHEDFQEATDEKNIRRRVYDALNVLKALNIIAVEKKDIIWKGIGNEAAAPADSATTQETKKQLNELRKATQEREQFLVDISNECSNMEALVKRNQKMTGALNETQPGVWRAVDGTNVIPMPFTILHSKRKTRVDVSMSAEKDSITIDYAQEGFEHCVERDVLVLLRAKRLQGFYPPEPAVTAVAAPTRSSSRRL